MKSLQDKLTDILEERDLYTFDLTSPQFQEAVKTVELMESTKIVFGKVITELKAREILTVLAQLAPKIQQKYNRPLCARELQRVLEALLRMENYAGGDRKAIEQEVQALMTDEGVIQTIKMELAKRGIEFDLKPDFNRPPQAAPAPAQPIPA